MTTTPKPGPHLYPTDQAPAPADRRPTFRDLAKRHALRASELADQAADLAANEGRAHHLDRGMDMAALHASVSLACSAVAPAMPQRFIHNPAADK